MAGLVRRHAAGYACRQCEARADSQLERRVWAACEELGVQMDVYPKVLRGRYGSVDVFLPAAQLMVMVDGPGHIDECTRWVPLAEQQRIDADFDAEVQRQGKRLLRLHYRDIERGDAARHIQRALRAVAREPRTGFIRFSKRYLRAGKQPCKFALGAP